MDETKGSESIKKAGAPLALAALLCLPCLLPVIVAAIGIATFSAAGGWLANNALVVVLASSGAIAGAVLATYMVLAKRRRPACETDEPLPAGRGEEFGA